MKTLKQFLEALIELVFLVITSIFTFIRWIWRKLKSRWKRCKAWAKAVIIFLTPKYEWIASIHDNEDYDDTLTVFCDINNKRGYLNAYTGEVVIEPQYDAAWVFSEGLAAVKKDNMIAFINLKGDVVIPFKFRHNKRKYDYDYIDYAFHDRYCYMISDDGYHGVIDKTGEWVIEPNYYIINRIGPAKGFFLITEDYKEGYVNSKMGVLFPAEYDDIVLCPDGYILTNDNRMWKEDLDGNVTVPFMYEYISDLEYVIGCDKDIDYIYELSDKYKKYYVNGFYGIYDIKTDKVVTPAIYTDIEMLDKDLFSVELEDSACYIIDGTGKRVN